MGAMLPTAEDLEKLTLRAVVAYAARTARRLSNELRGTVPDEILDQALRAVESVTRTNVIVELDKAAVIRAAERVTAAYANAPADLKSLEKFRIVFSLVHAAEAAMFALLAVTDTANARQKMKNAVKEALRSVEPIEVLCDSAATIMREAARQDYNILLLKYGDHEGVVVGEPVDCFGDD